MVYLAFESLDALPLGEMSLRGEAEGINQVFASCRSTIFSLYNPFETLLVEFGANHSALEGRVLPDVQLLVHELKILT